MDFVVAAIGISLIVGGLIAFVALALELDVDAITLAPISR
jgi:hypothetical protein